MRNRIAGSILAAAVLGGAAAGMIFEVGSSGVVQAVPASKAHSKAVNTAKGNGEGSTSIITIGPGGTVDPGSQFGNGNSCSVAVSTVNGVTTVVVNGRQVFGAEAERYASGQADCP